MAIEYRPRGKDGKKKDVVMTACPFCPAEFGENDGFVNHVDDCPGVRWWEVWR